jgi:hypothetical protein
MGMYFQGITKEDCLSGSVQKRIALQGSAQKRIAFQGDQRRRGFLSKGEDCFTGVGAEEDCFPGGSAQKRISFQGDVNRRLLHGIGAEEDCFPGGSAQKRISIQGDVEKNASRDRRRRFISTGSAQKRISFWGFGAGWLIKGIDGEQDYYGINVEEGMDFQEITTEDLPGGRFRRQGGMH